MAFYSSNIIKQPLKKKKSPLKMILGFLLVSTIVGGYYITTQTNAKTKLDLYRCYWDSSVISEKHGVEGKMPVEIVEGSNILQIGASLQEAGIIENAHDFACYSKKIGAGKDIQAGYYEISGPINLEQLIPQLKLAAIPTIKVTLQEGLRMDEIGKKLDTAFSTDNPINEFHYTDFLQLTVSKDILSSKKYLKGRKNIEGFLFPDTYEFTKDSTAEDVINTMLENFEYKTNDLKIITQQDAYEVVILASIIEKEAGRSFEEKRMISDILQKRLETGYFLEVDAPFLYYKKDWKAPIMATDKLVNSPYNTYINKGLTGTPICNPGYDSIAAVLDRKHNDYWFYLHGTDGQVRYGKTFDDHLKNISLYLR